MNTPSLANTGRRVVVTGGSKGIGAGIARAFGQAGDHVLIVARDPGPAAAVVREITEFGGEADAVPADLATAEGVRQLVQAVRDRLGGVDVVCANAGIFPSSSLETMTAEELSDVLDVNLKGTILTVQACLPFLRESTRGRVVLTSSITGPITGYPGWSHYGASKAGQLGFMRTAAVELAPLGITVNAVLPGNIATEGLDDLGAEYRRSMEAAIPMGRLGSVNDIAHAVVFFASEQAGYITGQSLVIDGGQVLPESPQALDTVR